MSDDNRTIWCGNLSEKVTEQLLYELFLQAAPLERVRIPVDKEGRKSNFAFITVKHEISVDYTVRLLSGTTLYGRSLNIRARNTNNPNRPQQSPEVNQCVQPKPPPLLLLKPPPLLLQPPPPPPQPNDCTRLEPLIRPNNNHQRHSDNYRRDDRRRDHNRNNKSNNRKYDRRIRFY